MTTTIGTRQSLLKIKDEVEYYQHQLDGIRQMARMGSLILADDMGLGKTLEALTVAAIDFQIGAASRVLVVAPAGLKWNWEAELEQFTHFTWTLLDGTPAERKVQLADFVEKKHDVLITNYEQVQPHLDDFNALRFDMMMFDEAHYIKNFKGIPRDPTKNKNAARAQAAHGLIAKRFLLLTGSPLLNHVDDLWSLLHRIAPVEFPDYWRFVNRYAVFGGYNNKSIVGVKNTAELRRRLQNLMVRRRKSEVLKLPPKNHIRIVVELTPLQRKLYDQAKDELLIEMPEIAMPDGSIRKPDDMEVENGLTRFLRLKQIIGTTAAIEGYADESAKLDVAVDRIEELIANEKHVVVFTQFRPVLEALAQRLAKKKIDTVQIHGGVPKKDRVPTVKAWGEAKPAVLGCMLQVAGVGLNMTKANTCIFLDKLFSPKLNEQAEDRLHRIGATGESIDIISIFARNTVDLRVDQILDGKDKVNTEVVEQSPWLKKLIEKALEEEGEFDA